MFRILFISAAFCAIVNGAILPKRAPKLNGRIIGGEDGDITDLPYQLALLDLGRQICGASIISANWAITAAHCVNYINVENISFRAGSNSETSGGSIHQASRIMFNPNYDWFTLDYDYALIEVSEPFPLGESGVQAIGLADVEPVAGDEATVSGWGRIENGFPGRLQVVRVPIISREDCVEIYDGYDVTERMICTGSTEGGKNACQGDFGGPLVVNGVLSGIASWGIGCFAPEFPSVYTSIATQRDWIREITGI